MLCVVEWCGNELSGKQALQKPYGADLLIGYQKGDTVRVASSVMRGEFGLILCDDAGQLLEVDGVIQKVMN